MPNLFPLSLANASSSSRRLALKFRRQAQAQALRHRGEKTLWPQLLRACSIVYHLENIGFNSCGKEIDKAEIPRLPGKFFSSSYLFRRG